MPQAMRTWHRWCYAAETLRLVASKVVSLHDIQFSADLGTVLTQNPGTALSGAASVARLKSGAMKLDLPSPAMLLTVRRGFNGR